MLVVHPIEKKDIISKTQEHGIEISIAEKQGYKLGIVSRPFWPNFGQNVHLDVRYEDIIIYKDHEQTPKETNDNFSLVGNWQVEQVILSPRNEVDKKAGHETWMELDNYRKNREQAKKINLEDCECCWHPTSN